MAFFCRLGRYYARLHGIAPTSSLWFDIREIQNYQMEQSRPLHAQFPHPNITSSPIWYKVVLWWNLSRVYCMVRWSGVHLNISWMSTQEFSGPPLQCLWMVLSDENAQWLQKGIKQRPLAYLRDWFALKKDFDGNLGCMRDEMLWKVQYFRLQVIKVVDLHEDSGGID